MAQRPTHYDLKSVYLTIGGYEIGGYGADGGIEFANGSPVREAMVGADGHGVSSETNDKSMTCTITVMETSKSYRDLATLARNQDGQRPLEALSFLCRDILNGDEVSEPYAVFLEHAVPSKGKSASERVFVIWLPNGREDAKYGASIAL